MNEGSMKFYLVVKVKMFGLEVVVPAFYLELQAKVLIPGSNRVFSCHNDDSNSHSQILEVFAVYYPVF